MSYSHGTYGWWQYEEYVAGLAAAGSTYTEERKDDRYVRGPSVRCWCRCPKEAPDSCAWCTKTCGCFQRLRVARWMDPATSRRMICEEYLAMDDRGSHGASMVGIIVYEEGHRPEIRTIEVSRDGDFWAFNAEYQAEEDRYLTERETDAYERSHFPEEFEEGRV